MPETNSRLKAIIHDAKLSCRDKLKAASEVATNKEEDVISMIDKVKVVFAKFDDTAIWMKPIPFDESTLLGQIIMLNEAPTDNMDELSNAMNDFLDAFDKLTITVTTRSFDPPGETTDPWNVRALNALRKTRVQIDTKIEVLQANGNDPRQEPDFPAAEEEQHKLIKAYRKALIDNVVQAEQTDVILFNKFEEIFKIVKELDKFITFYGAYTKAIRKRAPQPAGDFVLTT